jgi:hypothetical protein
MQTFIPSELWPERRIVDEIDSFLNPVEVGMSPKGTRYGIWLLRVEKYRGEKEPDLAYSRSHGIGHNRIIQWTYYGDRTLPQGWKFLSKLPHAKIGYVEITDRDNYFSQWTHNNKNYRRQWRNKYLDIQFKACKVTYEEFVSMYAKSTTRKNAGMFSHLTMNDHFKAGKTQIDFWCIQKISDGTVAAGIAIEYSQSLQYAYYLAAFYSKDSSVPAMMVGLIDLLFEESIKRGSRYIDFGEFWTPGKPQSWKGFSAFKSRFGTQYTQIPPSAYRIELVGVIAKLWELCKKVRYAFDH